MTEGRDGPSSLLRENHALLEQDSFSLQGCGLISEKASGGIETVEDLYEQQVRREYAAKLKVKQIETTMRLADAEAPPPNAKGKMAFEYGMVAWMCAGSYAVAVELGLNKLLALFGVAAAGAAFGLFAHVHAERANKAARCRAEEKLRHSGALRDHLDTP